MAYGDARRHDGGAGLAYRVILFWLPLLVGSVAFLSLRRGLNHPDRPDSASSGGYLSVTIEAWISSPGEAIQSRPSSLSSTASPARAPAKLDLAVKRSGSGPLALLQRDPVGGVVDVVGHVQVGGAKPPALRAASAPGGDAAAAP